MLSAEKHRETNFNWFPNFGDDCWKQPKMMFVITSINIVLISELLAYIRRINGS